MLTVNKIIDLPVALERINEWKSQGQEIVFTNGCFDILHAGHVDYLEKASLKGDRLVVGLNTDDSVRRIKGEKRPIIDESSRSRVLAALGFVDAVVLFEEDTPIELIKQLLPDILVKGKDYDISNIVGADIVMQNGGKVETIDLTEGLSTTNVISKIRKLN